MIKDESRWNVMIEDESRWNIINIPKNYKKNVSVEIEQGYLDCNIGDDLRVRKETDSCNNVEYFLTSKRYINELQREESNKELTKNEFEKLWKQTEQARIKKTRFMIPFKGFLIELNIYSGALNGLVVAEVEFNPIRLRERFVPPIWFGRDVTQDREYENRCLACNGLPRNGSI